MILYYGCFDYYLSEIYIFVFEMGKKKQIWVADINKRTQPHIIDFVDEMEFGYLTRDRVYHKMGILKRNKK